MLAAWALVVLIARVRGQCYLPGGDLARNDRPCNPKSFTSFCCSSGYTCFENRLCIVTDRKSGLSLGLASRGSCTNPLWDESSCGDFCLNNPVNDNNGSLVSCGNGAWCCSPAFAAGTCDCSSGTGTFSVEDGEAITAIGVQGPLSQTATDIVPIVSAFSRSSSTSKSSSSSTSSSPITSSSTFTAPSFTSATNGVTRTITLTTTASAIGTTSSGVSSQNASSSDRKILGTGAIVGIAVGGSVALALLALVLFLCFRHKRSKRGRRTEPVSATRREETSLDTLARMAAVAHPPRPNPDPYAFVSDPSRNSYITSQQNMRNPHGTGVPDQNQTVNPRPQSMQYPPVYTAYDDVPPAPTKAFRNRDRYPPPNDPYA